MAKRKSSMIEQAAKARRLAKSIPDEDASRKLLKLAEEYEALAIQEEEQTDLKDTFH
jgi:hypothetical protein